MYEHDLDLNMNYAKKRENGANMAYHNSLNRIVSRVKAEKVSASLKKRKRNRKQFPRRALRLRNQRCTCTSNLTKTNQHHEDSNR